MASIVEALFGWLLQGTVDQMVMTKPRIAAAIGVVCGLIVAAFYISSH